MNNTISAAETLPSEFVFDFGKLALIVLAAIVASTLS